MLEWTGERFLPWINESALAYEHLHRYAYAATLVKGKRVLDLACGEGYGSRMLAETASSVVGVDIDEDIIGHAAERYRSPALQFMRGSITAVPISEGRSFDAIVCFEAIEHIEGHDALLCEVKRLLSPSGIFIVSTPNKALYRDAAQFQNPFHVRELYFRDFQELLERHFRNVSLLGQRIHPGSSIWPIRPAGKNGFAGFVVERLEAEFRFISDDKRDPLYFVAVASDSTEQLPASVSILLDHSDGHLKEARDLERVRRNVEESYKACWERETAALAAELSLTQRQLKSAEQQLAAIHNSPEWKFASWLRRLFGKKKLPS
jgi:SAM-dependent methyltransferase